MAENNNEKLFKTKILPIMDKVKEHLQAMQAKEQVELMKSKDYWIGDKYDRRNMVINLRVTGKWNSKHTEDYIKMVNEELKRQHINPTPEIEKMMINKMIEDKVPRSSIEYVIQKSFKGSVFCMLDNARRSNLEKHIDVQAERRYNPSGGEKLIADAGSGMLNCLACGVVNPFSWAAVPIVGVDILSSSTDDDEDPLEKSKKPKDVTALEYYKNLRNFIPKESPNALRKAVGELAKEELGVKLKETPIPKWMEGKSDDLLYKMGTYFAGLACEMKAKGITSKKVGKDVMTLAQVTQRAFDYSRAYEQRKNSQAHYGEKYSEASRKDLQDSLRQSIPLEDGEKLKSTIVSLMSTDEGKKIQLKETPIPKWMESKSDEELYKMGTFYASLAYEMKAKGITSKKVGKDVMTVEQVAQRAYDYSRALAKSQRMAAGTAVTFDDLGESEETGKEEEKTIPTSEKDSQDTIGWNNLFDQLGLSSFGNTAMNFGYVLAMLPDILIGMFTGQSNIKLKDNLLPIGAIAAGLFVKNPLLKMLLIGLGGANMLNKAGKEALGTNGQEQPVRNCRKYEDEPLNPRLQSPVIKGNSMIVKIDNALTCVQISESAIDAYERGLLPLNTLSNAVLQKYDEQQQSAQQNFDRKVNESEAITRSRGIA